MGIKCRRRNTSARPAPDRAATACHNDKEPVGGNRLFISKAGEARIRLPRGPVLFVDPGGLGG